MEQWKEVKYPRKWQDYINERNEYVKIWREEKKTYEKNIIDWCKEQPKLLYIYVKDKLKNKHEIEKLWQDSTEYCDDLEMVEVIN